MKIPVKKLVALIMAFVLVLSTGVYCALADDDPAPASFKLDFENGNKGVASPSGDAILSVVEKSFEGSGSKSLYVSGRTKDYDAADVPLSALGAVVGDTLKIRVLGYVDTDADVPDGSLITVTLPNDYAYNGTVNLVKGQAFVIEATKEITNENSKNVRIQTNSAGATVPFYIDSIEIDVVKPGDESEETDSGEAPDPGAGESFDYAYDFEDDTLGAVVKGGNPTFTVVSKTFDGSGSKSLYVSGRTKDYDAADVPLSALGAVVGDTLKIRVLGYVDSDAEVPEGSQITVTVPDDYGYNGTVNLVKGQAFVIEATKKITNENSKNVRIQTNSAGATVPFYIDSIGIDVEKAEEEIDDGSDDGSDEGSEAGSEESFAYDFEDGLVGVVVKSGDAILSVVEKSFEGSETKSLYVSGRTKDYDAADVPLSVLGAVVGDTLKIRVLGYVDSDADVPEGSQITVTVPDDYGYNGTVNLVKGQAFVIEATKKITNENSKNVRIQTNAAGATVPFYIDSISIDVEKPEEESDDGADEGSEAGSEESFAYDFEDGKLGVVVKSGGATLAVVDKAFEGSQTKSLYVSGRTKDYDAADVPLSALGAVVGDKLKIRVLGYVDSDADVPDGSQITVTLPDDYAYNGTVNLVKGKAFVIEATKEITNENSKNVRIQTNAAGATVPFYIDSISIDVVKPGGSAEPEPEPGDKGEAVVKEFIFEFQDDADMAKIGNAGGAGTLSKVSGKIYDGNSDGYSAYITGRTDNWHGIDLTFASLGLNVGDEITDVIINGWIDEGEEGGEIAVQTIQSYGGWLGSAAVVAGSAFSISGGVRDGLYVIGTDTALRIQSSAGTFPFYIGNIKIVANVYGEVAEGPVALDIIDFEDGTTQGFSGRGGNETLTVVEDENHTEDGGKALKVEGRAQTWNGPSLVVTKYIEEGGLYKVSAWVKLIEPATTSLQLSTQVGNGSAANYATIKASGITASEGWVLYEGTYRYSNMSSGFASIYVESSSSATASFYIDDVAFEKVGNPITIEDDLTKIKEVYDGTFLIGNAVSAEDLGGVRLELLKNHFNIITPGNAGKPDALQPSKGNFTFTTTDALFQTAIDNGFLIHGHTLAWHQQSPTWLNRDADGKPLPREEALENLKTHAFTVVKHFSETFNAEEQNIISWDVVNEAMGDSIANSSDWKGSLRNTPWLEAIGWEYIEEAFLSAREADPNVKLYYNDYNLNGIAKATAVYEMIKDINTRYPDVGGRPLIDGVGMQGHYRLGVNPSGVENSIELFESLGIEISITELDIQAGSNSFLSEENEEAQAVLYAQLFQVFKNHSDSIARVTFWGLDDGASWRAETNPLLFDRDLQSKLAFDAVIDPDKFLEDYVAGNLEGKKIEANYGTPEIDGEEDEIWADAEVIDIDKFQLAWQGAKGKGKLLWDDEYLYALVTVSDTELDKASANAYEQDSVEVFVDENNAKSSSYEADDGQYRVNFDNETSFDHGLSEGFESATKIDGTTYTVELKIPWKTITPENDFEVGVDISINDARNGFRQSVSAWSDSFGTAYADPSVFGTATLVGKPEESEEPTPAAPTPAASAPAVSQPSTSIPSVGIKVGELDDPATGDKVYASLGVTVGADKVGTVVIYDYVADALIQKAATLPAGEPRVYAIEVKTGNSEGVKVRIPWASLNSFATSYKDASFAVYSDKWEVRFDNKALFAILGSSTGLIDITVKKIEAPNALSGRPAYDFSVSKNSVYISDFLGGRAFTRIPYALGAGEDPNALVVYWIDGNRITPVRSVWRGSYLSFSSYHFSSFGIGYNPVSYTDVSDSAYYAKAASYLGARGIFEGPLFEPGKAATRGEAIVTLLKAYGIEPLGASAPNFADATGEYAGYYAKAKAIGLSVGIGNNLLAPDLVLNRETLFALVYNLLDILEELPEAKTTKSVSAFNDASSFSDWAKAPVGKLVDAGILAGTGNGEFRPLDSSNRAQLANAIYRLELGETAE